MKQITRVVLVFLVGLSCISCGEQPESNVTEESPAIDAVITSRSDSSESSSAEPESETVEELLNIPDKPLSEDRPWLIINSSPDMIFFQEMKVALMT